MMKEQLDMLLRFHKVYGHTIGSSPQMISAKDSELRLRLHREEAVVEYNEAIINDNIIKVFDSCLDGLYVIYGTLISHGLHHIAEEGFAEVHRSNMTKVWPDGTIHKDSGGKTIKPPNFAPPDLGAIIARGSPDNGNV